MWKILLAVSNSAHASVSSRWQLPSKNDKYEQSAICRSFWGGGWVGWAQWLVARAYESTYYSECRKRKPLSPSCLLLFQTTYTESERLEDDRAWSLVCKLE